MHSRRQIVKSRLSSLVNKQVKQTEQAYFPSLSSLWLLALVLLSGPRSAVYTEEKEVDRATHLINYTHACRAAPSKTSRSADIWKYK